MGLRLDHLAAEFVDAEDAALDQRLRNRVDPALVITHLVISILPQALDIAAELVDRHVPLLGEQHQEGVDAFLPERVVVLGGLYRSRGEPAHVVDAAIARHRSNEDPLGHKRRRPPASAKDWGAKIIERAYFACC